MRVALLGVFAVGCLMMGGTCLPLVDNTTGQAKPAQSLAIAILDPSEAKTVPRGSSVPIQWSASNRTGSPATISVLVESRKPGLQRTLLEEIELEGTGASATVTWNTEDFSGPYSIIARIATAELTRESTSAGLITVDGAPTFEFTAPTGNVTFRPDVDPPLVIAWKGSDESATARIGLDPDTDHDSGNEIFILERELSESSGKDNSGTRQAPITRSDETGTTSETETGQGTQEPTTTPEGEEQEGEEEETSETGPLPETGSESEVPPDSSDSFEWDGKDLNDEAVEPGTYNLFAKVSDDVNEVLIVEGHGQITIAEAENEEPQEGPAILEPAEDTDFLASDESLTIEYRVGSDSDVLVDIKIDTDDNHANGNERVILSQQFVEGGEDPDPFEWDGTDASGGEVEPGIYRLVVAVSSGEGNPQVAEGSGLVMRRETEDQPLIALLQPAALATVDPGNYVTIRWRDDDPSEEATIRLVVDTTTDPLSATEHRLEILSGREAAPDDVQDTFAWQVPNTLPPGTYYVIAFIGDGEGNTSVAPAPVIIRDPTNP